MFGFGNAEFQVSGATHCPDSNWAAWKYGKNSGIACDFWNLYEKDIWLAKKMGANAFRISIEWSTIQPTQDSWNQDAINHYHQVINCIINHDMAPVITLHHFTDPIWFSNLEGFENEENIDYFVDFCKKIFIEFSPKVTFWCTINEPTIYAFMGYVLGLFPPGYRANLNRAGNVLKNMLKAHVKIYYALKKLPYGKQAQIGIVHQLLRFEAYHSWNKLDKALADFFTTITHTAAFNFLKTGNFSWKFARSKPVYYQDNSAPYSFDFIGLNYYSRVLINFLQPSHAPGEIMTDYQYAMYPIGVYNAIKEISQLGAPIYITENGIADARDDRRPLLIQQYLEKVAQAINEGYDVRGYFWWTLTDNFEWHEGYSKKFGIFEMNYNTQARILRDSGILLRYIFSNRVLHY